MPLDPAPENPWRTVSSTVIYRSRRVHFLEDRLEGPNGEPGLYGYFSMRDSVIVCPLLGNGSVLLVRRWLPANATASWELPCASVDSGQSVEDCAIRALTTVGARARTLAGLGAVHSSDSRVGGQTHCFLAEGVETNVFVDGDGVCESMPFADAVRAVREGELTHMTTAYLLLRVQRLIDDSREEA